MNTVTEPIAVGYEQDFHAWSRHQAELVRQGRFAELDRDNLVEEIESMGNEQLSAVESFTRQVLVHLLLLQCSPALDPRHHWIAELANFRADIESRLKRSPSLQPRLAGVLQDQWPRARRVALAKLAADGVRHLPDECPYTLERVLDFDWLPRHEASG